jgi:hypothetical protein
VWRNPRTGGSVESSVKARVEAVGTGDLTLSKRWTQLPSFARPDSREPALSLPKGRLSPHGLWSLWHPTQFQRDVFQLFVHFQDLDLVA